MKKAIILGAIFETIGILLVGSHATEITSTKIIDLADFAPIMEHLTLGLFCTLVIAFTWVASMTKLGLPVSTTHTVISGMIGFTLLELGGSALIGWGVGKTLLGWFASPFLGGILAFGIYYLVNRFILEHPEPLTRAYEWIPLLGGLSIGLWGFFIGWALRFIGGDMPLWADFVIFAGLFIVFGTFAKFVMMPYLRERRAFFEFGRFGHVMLEEHIEDANDVEMAVQRTEIQFKLLSILTAATVVFAHGLNNTQMLIGPLVGIWEYRLTGTIDPNVPETVPLWSLFFIVFGCIIGLTFFGQGVMKTIGHKITELNHPRTYTVQLSTAIILMFGTLMGLSFSLGHVLVGSVVGVGLVPHQRLKTSVDKKALIKIGAGWIATLIVSPLLTMALYAALRTAI
eukprot:TRINITY_DN9594_c0_g1_i1.p1 TRINITY_DN9594_c0_g1~~TRINITY_DN9594_c0_g1_i1.p1  ORF type:complete len:466 (-),score=102.70 TRINITY_DN9594_c0_g1_i1:48-1244(-)